jgi:hypothetical protein
MRLKSVPIFCALALLVFSSTQSHAQTLECYGTVRSLGIGNDGSLAVAINTSPPTPTHYICNITSQGSFRMNTDACKVAYATLLTAKATDKFVRIYYAPAGGTCGAIGGWVPITQTYFVEGPH